MSDEEPEGAPAQNPAAHFSVNIMNLKQPKINTRQENRLEALKAFKKKCGYVYKDKPRQHISGKKVYTSTRLARTGRPEDL